MDQTETTTAAALPSEEPARRFPPRCERCGDIPHPWRECEQFLLDMKKSGPKE